MKKFLSLLCLSVVIVVACSEVTHHDYTFTGESEHWEAEYVYEGTEKRREEDGVESYSNEMDYEFILTYKGTLEELSPLERLSYSYETTSSGGESTRTFNEPPSKVTFTKRGGSTGSSVMSKDEVIQVTVKWGEAEELFELRNERK
ncbi:hypothetical protein MUN88_07075 [Gracilibacillus caseinilyticus]|uniref:Lipoprotein n=1 Tax=Gracilibacillus caseinilyticus TaxID=2932256 RepID=A0ABY4F1S7_9BACI|nr:hypothetical protein [Gracilibacillus caseinilyticus]UOQ49829.1 hypothetical protein MUN88_07075 [Gracilibacillus caseinilyticus]